MKKSRKADIHVTVDKDILAEAKTIIPNMSKGIEDYLKCIIQSQTETEKQLRIQLKAEETKLQESKNRVAVLKTQLKNQQNNNQETIETKNQAWTNFKIELQKRAHDKKYKYMDENIVEDAEKVLGYDKKTLIKIDRFVTHNYKKFDCPPEKVNKWEVVETEWRKYQC